jgi:mannose-1-phosphate guanylyltransferase
MTLRSMHRNRWCVVIADDHGPEWIPASRSNNGRSLPVQYCRLRESSTLLQKALRRAAKIAPTAQVAVTALEEYREYWEPSLWFTPPANRFICDNRAASTLTAAAALLSIANQCASSIVTVLPARCHVEHESVLEAAMEQAIALLPHVAEGVITLGMVDLNDGIDEDYLITGRPKSGPGFTVQGYARRPISWVAHHLRQQGASIASGITIGYAGAFAAHISKHWPGITTQLGKLIAAAAEAGVECEVPLELQRGMPTPKLRFLRWQPPSFSQRAFRVFRCGWSSLKSPRAVERILTFIENAADANQLSSVGAQHERAVFGF